MSTRSPGAKNELEALVVHLVSRIVSSRLWCVYDTSELPCSSDLGHSRGAHRLHHHGNGGGMLASVMDDPAERRKKKGRVHWEGKSFSTPSERPATAQRGKKCCVAPRHVAARYATLDAETAPRGAWGRYPTGLAEHARYVKPN